MDLVRNRGEIESMYLIEGGLGVLEDVVFISNFANFKKIDIKLFFSYVHGEIFPQFSEEYLSIHSLVNA